MGVQNMNSSFARITLLTSLGLNFLLLIMLIILEARVEKLESKHYDSTPLEIKIGLNGK
jgi:hypothetical protein